MEPGAEIEADTALLTVEQQGEEWNAAFGPYVDEDGVERPPGEFPPNHGLIDLLQACPCPFEIPPRQKDFTRPLNFADTPS